jgi:acylphosphatase
MSERVQVRVSGTVQGVGFRYFTQHTAAALGLTGAVRNTADGVEAIAEGPEPALREFVEALRRGPSAAQVDDLTEAWGQASGEFATFSVVA